MNSSARLACLLFATAALVPGQRVYPIANMFKPQATPADSIYNISILMLAICAAIFLVVGGLLLFTIVRFRRPKVDNSREPVQVYGSNRIEIAWTVIPVLIVLVLSMATARAVVETEISSGGCRIGVAIIPASSSPAKPATARPQTTALKLPETIVAIMT